MAWSPFAASTHGALWSAKTRNEVTQTIVLDSEEQRSYFGRVPGLAAPLYTSFIRSRRAGPIAPGPPARACLRTGWLLARVRPQHAVQVEHRRVVAELRQQRMNLRAMMGLVIEKVRH